MDDGAAHRVGRYLRLAAIAPPVILYQAKTDLKGLGVLRSGVRMRDGC